MKLAAAPPWPDTSETQRETSSVDNYFDKHRHHRGAGLCHLQQEGGLSVSWQEGVVVAVVLLGLGAGAFLVARRPSFWIEFGSRLAKALLPLAWRYVSRRMPPEEEAPWRQAERRGQCDEWLRKRCRVRRKTQI